MTSTEAPSSFDGCRDPKDTYNGLTCKKGCCKSTMYSKCTHFSRSKGSNWFNGQGDCPTDMEKCPKCASCFTRDEEELMSIHPPKKCSYSDCPNMDQMDACRNPKSCECFCSRAKDLMLSCPNVKPKWLPIG